MKARRSAAPTKVSQLTNALSKSPKEMLKMEQPPGMCMKIKGQRQNIHPQIRLFTRKCANCAILDNNLAGFLAENAWIGRQIGPKLCPCMKPALANPSGSVDAKPRFPVTILSAV